MADMSELADLESEDHPPPPPPNDQNQPVRDEEDISKTVTHTQTSRQHPAPLLELNYGHFGEDNIGFAPDLFSHGHNQSTSSNSGQNVNSSGMRPPSQQVTNAHNQHVQQQQQQQQPSRDDSWEQSAANEVVKRVGLELTLNSAREYSIAKAAALRMVEFCQQHMATLSRQNAHLQHMLNAHQRGFPPQAAQGGRRDLHQFNMGMMMSTGEVHSLQGIGTGPNLPQISLSSDGLKAEPGDKRKLTPGISTSSSSSKKSRSSRWTHEQDQALKDAVTKYEGRNWKAIAELVPGRDHVQCLQRWKKVLRPGLVKGHWTADEDALLLQLIQDEKMHSWAMVASKITGRTAKQCRERWSLNLDPGINRAPWTPDEDSLLLQMYDKMGGKWSEIKTHFDGRTENAVKTRYKSLVRAKAREWTPEQDRKLVQLRMKYGKNWAAIKKELPGRSRNAIKVRCKTLEYDSNNMSVN